MEIINTILGIPFGYIMYFCYEFIGDYGWAIILFTLITKILLFPISLSSQKNSIKMVKMQPYLEDIKLRNTGNTNLILEEQKQLYKREKYSVLKSVLPLLIQIPIIFGVINVIYNPLQHLLHIDNNLISEISQKTAQILNVSELGFGAQLQMLQTIKSHPLEFLSIPGFSEVASKLTNFNLMFMGIDLSSIPTLTGILLIIPLLSGLSALLLCIIQNKYNVLQKEQGFLGKWGVSIFLVIFSAYFAFIVPAGIGVYWIAGNILSIAVTILCNLVYNPAKYIDYENRTQKPKLTKEEKDQKKQAKKIEKERSKQDSKKFFSQEKQLVFYSESNGFFKYFKGVIEYITENSDITVHYVTSDINDNILKTNNPKIIPYFIGGNALIPFMMKMDADMVVMTLPDLEKYHIKRSLIKRDCEYIYLDHGMTSFHLMLREGALDHYDTIFCYGPNHIDEIRETEKVYDLPQKKLVKTGYVLLDELLDNVSKMDIESNKVKQVLIAPSWQKDNIMEYCLDELLEPLINKDFCVIVRPHPEFVKRFSAKMDKIIEKYKQYFSDKFIIETDFSSNKTVYSSDIVITDWSSIAQEFSYSTKKPSIFINTPMKIMNPNYKKISPVPLDISLRDQIGVSVDINKLNNIYDIVKDLIKNTPKYKEKITKVLYDNIYNVGNSKEVTGEYIISTLEKIKVDKIEQNDIENTIKDDNAI